jgi:hypothetical protein
MGKGRKGVGGAASDRGRYRKSLPPVNLTDSLEAYGTQTSWNGFSIHLLLFTVSLPLHGGCSLVSGSNQSEFSEQLGDMVHGLLNPSAPLNP